VSRNLVTRSDLHQAHPLIADVNAKNGLITIFVLTLDVLGDSTILMHTSTDNFTHCLPKGPSWFQVLDFLLVLPFFEQVTHGYQRFWLLFQHNVYERYGDSAFHVYG